MKNTVFVPVPTEERLPPIETKVQTIHLDSRWGAQIEVMVLDKKGSWFFYPSDVHGCEPEYWLEEKEDRSQEMFNALKSCQKIIKQRLNLKITELDDLITSIEKGETK